jgi:hypothetical protein
MYVMRYETFCNSFSNLHPKQTPYNSFSCVLYRLDHFYIHKLIVHTHTLS